MHNILAKTAFFAIRKYAVYQLVTLFPLYGKIYVFFFNFHREFKGMIKSEKFRFATGVCKK